MLIKKRHYRPVPDNAEIFTRRGHRYARWTNGRGMTQTRPVNAEATRIVCESRGWYVRLKDPATGRWREWKAYTDKTASRAMEAELTVKLERGDAGVLDPHADHRRRPLAGHIGDYEGYLSDKGNTAEYVALTIQRCRSLLVEGIKAETVGDITPGRVEGCLADFRRNGLPQEPASDRKPKPLSIASSNHYVRAVKGFCRWLVKDRRIAEDPVAGLAMLKVSEHSKKRRRRPLTDDELQQLIQTAMASERLFRGLTGEDRAMLYLVAANTGLRAAELGSLTPVSFNLQSEPSTVRCLAAYTKNGQEAIQPLPGNLAGILEPWLSRKSQGLPVWPGTWANKASAKMLRGDLAKADIPYVDSSGRYADFHSLRHTFISNLARSGAHPRVAQALARHSKIDLTMNFYTHTVIGDLAQAVENLPAVALGAEPQTQALAATGTDGADPYSRLPDSQSKRRTKRRANPDSGGRNKAIHGEDWRNHPPDDSEQKREPKSLKLTEKDEACHTVTGPVLNETDGIRTRNLRIDSPAPDLENTRLTLKGAQKGALSRHDGSTDNSDLAELVAAWPLVPDHIRAAILALLHSSLSSDDPTAFPSSMKM